MKNMRAIKSVCALGCWLLISVCGYSQQNNLKEKPVYYFNPCWSPDGTRILFESTMNGESAIYTIAKDGTNLKQITQHKSGQPAWSPDGHSIVYYRDLYKKLQLFTNTADGGIEKQLLSTSSQDYGPSWSKNGKIAFMSNPSRDHISHYIFTVNADGSDHKKLTDTTYDHMSPKWSPDGNKLLYTRGTWTSKLYKTITREEMQKINQSAQILIMDADGGGHQQITESNSNFDNPVWAPGGKAIYLKSMNDTTTIIYRVELNGNKFNQVCMVNKKIGSFDISPNEDLIVYDYAKKNKYSLYIFDIKTGADKKLLGDD